MKKQTYYVHGLTTEQLTTIARDAFKDPDKYKDVRFIFDTFGYISHLEVDLTKFKAALVRLRMKVDNFRERKEKSKYILIKKQ